MRRAEPPCPVLSEEPDAQAAYQALLAHDARFDGHWLVGVTTTGIYCRPICRVRVPLERHCRFFRHAALAEQAGFRPCLRCRPEQAPGLSLMESSRSLARVAARRIAQSVREGEPMALAQLARDMGVTDRHLRRIFQAEHGVTPVSFQGTQRLLQAKHLLTDTDWPVTTVALASGFGSLRRFHAAFAERYRLQPAQWRRAARPTGGMIPRGASPPVEVALAYRPPYDHAGALHFLQRRSVPGLEQAEGPAGAATGGATATWRRTLAVPHEGHLRAGWIAIRFVPGAARIALSVSSGLAPALGKVVQRVREALDLDADPEAIAAGLPGLPVPFVPGQRVMGSVDGFEAAVRVILGQQVSVAAARTLTARLVAALGQPVDTPFAGLDRLFPTPRALAEAPAEVMGSLGIVRQRVVALQALARAVDSGALRLRAGAPWEETRARLLDLPGVGEWTAELIAMRALNWPDAFAARDLGVLHALAPDARGTRRRTDAREVLAQAERWRPWRAYAVMALWRALDPPPSGADLRTTPSPRRPSPARRTQAGRLPLPSLAPHLDGATMPDPTLTWRRIDTPLGEMLLAASLEGLAGAWFQGQQHHPGDKLPGRPQAGPHAVLDAAADQLAAFFSGRRQAFDLPLDPWGGTDFQRAVWQALTAIPPGETRCYGDIARACGRPAAVRAVGAAIGRNPISIIVPCHRVLGADGRLTGYAGGLDRKAALLQLEGCSTRPRRAA